MREFLRTNDPVRISWLTAVLAEREIEVVVLDTHMSILEGQVGAIPRRLMVLDEDFDAAVDFVQAAEAENEEDTADMLLGGRLRFHQPAAGYRVAIDPIFLAAAIPAEAGARVLDVGTGAGAAAICLAARVEGARVVGLELAEDWVDFARRNAAENDLDGRVTFYQGDLLAPPQAVARGGFDHVMANPPHLPATRADPRTGPGKARAHIEGGASLADWIDFCLRMVAPKGTVTMIHRADRLDEILGHLWGRAGGMVVYPLWPKAEQAPKRIIVRARPGIAAPFRLDPGMVLHRDDGGYAAAAESVLTDAGPIVL
jgi:tRNA1(Val) A37 N6-methylase TrmN6